jgi:hypothetical protein
MAEAPTSVWQELATPAQRDELARLARERRWGLSLLLVGWLHLLAFTLCYYLTVALDYHEPAGYLAVWAAELCTAGLVVRLCGGPRPAGPAPPLARLIARVWLAYFVLAFNLCAMNGLRGHRMFELFPALASLGSFGFLVMAFAVHRRFFGAVLVMFPAGLLMAAQLRHAYLVFGLAWWLVLHGIGLALLAKPRPSPTPTPWPTSTRGSAPVQPADRQRQSTSPANAITACDAAAASTNTALP